jgi:ADP-heptose:LPS heptosyltransferase
MKHINPCSKILLIRPEMMGDTILMTSIVSSIKKQYPDSKIYMLLQHPMEEVIKHNKDISGHIFTKKRLGIKDFFKLVSDIKKERFDISIVFEDNPTPIYVLLSFLAGIPNRIGDKARILYGWMFNKGVWINSADNSLHHIELYLKLLEPLNIFNSKQSLNLPLDIKAEKSITELLPEKTGAFIAIHIGTGGGNRALLSETYAKISDLLQERLSCKVFLIGGEKELDTLQRIKTLAKKPFIDLISKLSMQQLFSVLKRMDLFIGVDSGPMHAAAAFSIPTLAIYTAKDVNPVRWFPWMTRNVLVKSRNDCKLKCSHRECSFDYCLTAIEAEHIISEAIHLLNGRGNSTIEETRQKAL